MAVETDCDEAGGTVDSTGSAEPLDSAGVVAHWAAVGLGGTVALGATIGPGTEGTEGGGVITPEESNAVVIGVI